MDEASHLPAAASPTADFRFTRQRRVVYDALLGTTDHPSAAEVFLRVKSALPSISLATVYNCLETLAEHGLIRQVNLDRGASRFCANTRQHGHFFCTACNGVHDVDFPAATELARAWRLADDFVVTQADFSLRGLCPACATAQSSDPLPTTIS